MNHIEQEKLLSYGRRELSPAEFLAVHRHVENCGECQRRLKEMLPAIGESEEKTIVDFLTEKEEFHLDYENHLKPFVLKTADAVTCEIVESHIEVCPECLGDLRDLMEFHDTLEREIREKSSVWANLKNYFAGGGWRILALASVLIAAIAGIFWLSRTTPEIVQSPAEVQSPKSKVQSPAEVQSLRTESPISNVQSPPEVKSPEPANVQSPKPAESPKSNDQTPKPETEMVKPAENPESEIQNPKSKIQNPKSEDLAELRLPAVLNELKRGKDDAYRNLGEDGEGYRNRGGDEAETQAIKILSPNGQVIQENTPVLRWGKTEGVSEYEVIIFDAQDNRLAKIENFKGDAWRAPNLAKGKLYRWQVFAKTNSDDGKKNRFLGTGNFYIVAEKDEKRITLATDSLAKGRAFAEAGLLREAANEFRKYLKENPNSANVKKILRQVEQAQR